jgi:polynucleotide 5'-hydroxyl-kinase GRC3/NOL9
MVSEIQTSRGAVMVLGAPDTGKTTLTRYLVQELSKRGERIAYIDGDMGQAVLGPPTTQGMAIVESPQIGLEDLTLAATYFVGSTSPRGHAVETLVGLKRLLERSEADGHSIAIVDTTGYVTGEDAIELKHQKIDLLDPRHIVALQREDEIEPILWAHRYREKVVIHRLYSTVGAHTRSQDERRNYRWNRFQTCFDRVRLHRLDLRKVSLSGTHRVRIQEGHKDTLAGLLIGLNGPDNFLVTLGIVEGLTQRNGILSCLVPGSVNIAGVRTVRLGSIGIDLSEEKNGEKFFEPD